MTKNNSNWKTIEEEFNKMEVTTHIASGDKASSVKIYNHETNEYYTIPAFFKPYFQEQMHEKAVEELEVVDN